MKALAAVCLSALLVGLGLAVSLHRDRPSADGKAEAVRNGGSVKSDGEIGTRARGAPAPTALSWIAADAERDDDRGASWTWIPTDAERDDDRGAFLTWIPTDAERDDDQGALLAWTATDAERDDDIGVPSNRRSGHRL